MKVIHRKIIACAIFLDGPLTQDHIRNMMTAEQLKKKREALRLRQNQLAKLCSLTPAMMCRIEKGKSDVPGYVDSILALLERDKSAIEFLMERRGL